MSALWRRLRSWAALGGLSLASVCLTALAFEAALRLFPYRHLIASRYLPDYYVPDAEAGYDIRPNAPVRRFGVLTEAHTVWSNDLGCFDNPYRGEPHYILLVGDSFVWGFAPFEHKFGTILEREVGVRTLRCGVSGYGTFQELIKARRVIGRTGHTPQLIIVAYYMNDLEDDYEFPNNTVRDGLLELNRAVCSDQGEICQARPSPLTPLRLWVERHSVLFDHAVHARIALESALLSKRSFDLDLAFYHGFDWIDRAWGQHLRHLAGFRDLADSVGARLLVLIIPTREQVYPFLYDGRAGPMTAQDWERPNRILTRYMDEQGIAYLDLLPLLRGYADETPRRNLGPADLYWNWDGHWNIKGNHLVGWLLARELLRRDLVSAGVTDREQRLAAVAGQIDQLAGPRVAAR